MNIKEFLKPEWKKFILPIVFILLFLVVVNFFYYSIVPTFYEYHCKIAYLDKKMELATEQNDTLAIKQLLEDMLYLQEDTFRSMREPASVFYFCSALFIGAINPISMPCEMIYDYVPADFCEFYMREDTYNCLKTLNVTTIPKTISDRVYKKASITQFVLNVLILFVEGYLISSVILFFYRRVKRRRKKVK